MYDKTEYRAGLATARRRVEAEGLAKGEAKGEAKGKNKIVKFLRAKGFSPKLLAVALALK